jgi:predicted DNA-binding protein (UPF0251 family)
MRRVGFIPDVTYFKPAGVPLRELDEVVLTVEELEAVRLKDHEGLEQEAAAERMQVSRPTFRRILVGARLKIAEALISGKAIRIEGGVYTLSDTDKGIEGGRRRAQRRQHRRGGPPWQRP